VFDLGEPLAHRDALDLHLEKSILIEPLRWAALHVASVSISGVPRLALSLTRHLPSNAMRGRFARRKGILMA
jgi:hypothetical protein